MNGGSQHPGAVQWSRSLLVFPVFCGNIIQVEAVGIKPFVPCPARGAVPVGQDHLDPPDIVVRVPCLCQDLDVLAGKVIGAQLLKVPFGSGAGVDRKLLDRQPIDFRTGCRVFLRTSVNAVIPRIPFLAADLAIPGSGRPFAAAVGAVVVCVARLAAGGAGPGAVCGGDGRDKKENDAAYQQCRFFHKDASFRVCRFGTAANYRRLDGKAAMISPGSSR